MRKTSKVSIVPEFNLSGPDPKKLAGGNFCNVQCYAPNTAASSTGRLQWQTLHSYHYPDQRTTRKRRDQNVSGRAWGSGGLISGNVFYTAGHCLDVRRDEGGWVTPYRPGTADQLNSFELAPLLEERYSAAS